MATPEGASEAVTGAALALGIVGAVTGALSLGWNIAAHLLNAGRAKVELDGGWVSRTSWVSVPLRGFGTTREPAELPTPVLIVRVTNVGRLPITVTQSAVEVDQVRYGELRQPRNPTLPHRLDVGDQGQWFFEVSEVLEVAEMAGRTSRKVAIRGIASTGTGGDRRSAQRTDPVTLSALVAADGAEPTA